MDGNRGGWLRGEGRRVGEFEERERERERENERSEGGRNLKWVLQLLDTHTHSLHTRIHTFMHKHIHTYTYIRTHIYKDNYRIYNYSILLRHNNCYLVRIF